MKTLFSSGRRAIVMAAMWALFFSIGLCMPQPAAARLIYRQQPAGQIARNNGGSVTYGEQANAQYEYGWRWNGPYTAAVLTGTAGSTVIQPLVSDTNVLSTYQGPFKIVMLNLTGTIYYSPSATTYSANSMTYTAANLTGIPLAASATADSGVIWPGQYWQVQALATVTQTASSFYFWVLDKDW